ncbi:hypothetical protein [Aliidiomarina sp.]|uniref:hypothetical protein n=1 Tax=Aliidiomarina sp. TaxID=1872439 RepID=UPI003A4D45A3
MSYQVLLTPIRQRFAPFALMRLGRCHTASYGKVIDFNGSKWAQLADARVPDFFTWAQRTFATAQLLLCFEFEQRFVVVGWNSAGPQCHQVLSWSELEPWLVTLNRISDFQPRVYYWSKTTALEKVVRKLWSDATEFVDWPKHMNNINVLPKITDRVHRMLQVTITLGLAVLLLWFWPATTQVVDDETDLQDKHHYYELTDKPGAAAPLLKFDAYLQSLLSAVSGWHVQEVHYRQGVLRYGMHREGGQLSDLRHFAEQSGMQLMSSGEQTWLLRSVTLPAIVSTDNGAQLSNSLPALEHLQDHLDDAIHLLVPRSKLNFQPPQKFSDWHTRVLAIGFEHSFTDDLLTLAEIIEGLPVRVLEMQYRVNKSQLHGFISIDVYGAPSR